MTTTTTTQLNKLSITIIIRIKDHTIRGFNHKTHALGWICICLESAKLNLDFYFRFEMAKIYYF